MVEHGEQGTGVMNAGIGLDEPVTSVDGAFETLMFELLVADDSDMDALADRMAGAGYDASGRFDRAAALFVRDGSVPAGQHRQAGRAVMPSHTATVSPRSAAA